MARLTRPTLVPTAIASWINALRQRPEAARGADISKRLRELLASEKASTVSKPK